MKEKKIKAILKSKINEIAKLSREIDKDFDKETIHNFRVTVKTLRSFLRLLRTYIHKPSLKIPKKFKRLYHIAGAIRDAQLEIETISDKQPGMLQYMDELHRMLDQQKKEWKKYYSKKTVRKLEDRLNRLKCEALHPEVLDNFFNDRTVAIDIIMQGKSPTDGQVHYVRKKIKDILYTAKIADKEWSAVHKQIESHPVKQLDKLADMIGDYNDSRQMLQHLHVFSSQSKEQNEKEIIKKFRNKEIRKLTAKKKSILAKSMKLAGKSGTG